MSELFVQVVVVMCLMVVMKQHQDLLMPVCMPLLMAVSHRNPQLEQTHSQVRTVLISITSKQGHRSFILCVHEFGIYKIIIFIIFMEVFSFEKIMCIHFLKESGDLKKVCFVHL